MSILGQGIDLVDIGENRGWINDSRDPLILRCFVQEELEEIGTESDRNERFAGRFAAKEVVLKALGNRFDGVTFSDVGIRWRLG